MSLFNHLFISLPNPPHTIFNAIKSSILTFIWVGHSKIKFTTIVKEYGEGGLKMINLDAFIPALKLTWLQKIQSYREIGYISQNCILILTNFLIAVIIML